jgi:hypothetical protein
MSADAFRELAKPLLTDEDAALLDLVGLDPQPLQPADGGHSYADSAPSCGCDFIDNWREWERGFRLNLARNRSLKLKREGASPVEPPVFPVDAASVAAKAVGTQEHPLEGEIFIDKARWNAIESLQGGDYFDRNIVFAYLLKLILLERRASFQTDIGFEEYKSLYASILEGVAAAGGDAFGGAQSNAGVSK